MKKLSTITNSFTIPDENNLSISTEGFAIWLVWNGELDSSVTQILQDYGGLPVSTEHEQSMWFFFSTEVLLALAKLTVWAQYNPMSIILEAFPATLLVDSQKNLSLQLDDKFKKQELQAPRDKILTLVHPKLQEAGHVYPGINYQERRDDNPDFEALTLTKEKWVLLSANSRLPYSSSQGWYCIVHPLGSPLDKKFQHGWRSMFAEVELILQKLKLKYTLFDTYLIVPLENLTTLRSWTKELIQTLFGMKDNNPEKYWPCVSVIVDKKGLTFNNELPQKIDVKWDNLTPNFPYINYRNAYLLGEGFHIQDLNFSSAKGNITQWCTVVHDSYSVQANRISVLLPDSFVAGKHLSCFYCGMKSHETSSCPSKKLPETSTSFWEDFNNIDIDTINLTYRSIEIQLQKEGIKAYQEFFEADNLQTQVLEGVFNINSYLQPRNADRIWALSGKEIDATLDANAYRENSQCWDLLNKMIGIDQKDLSSLEKEALNALNKNARDWRIKSLLGFIAIEKNDYQKAITYWKEAESYTSSILHQAWHYFLIGRVHEVLLQYEEAMDYYTSAVKFLPYWADPTYRILACHVKMGFAEQQQNEILELIKEKPLYFNKILLDPELERGHLPIMAMLYPLWLDSLDKSAVEKTKVLNLMYDLDSWFFPEHPIASILRQKIQELIDALDVRNYLAYRTVVNVSPILADDLERLKTRELQDLKNSFKSFLSNLESIRDEASWFPFPHALRSFNKDFNECAAILNWAFAANFNEPDIFKQAHGYIEPLNELLVNLHNQLKTIKTIRDVTLFGLILSKTFLIIEIIALVICFIAVPVLTFYGDALGLAGLQRTIKLNFWELQTVLISVISASALGISILTTGLTFDKKRENMLETAKQQREEVQQQRLNKILARKKAEQEKIEAREQALGIEAAKKELPPS